MPVELPPRLRLRVLVGLVFVTLPAILFYGILFRKAINVPFEDDYEALLDFVNQMAELRSASARTSYFFASMFNEYKLFFGHAVAWTQFRLFGHINVAALCAVGNGFVLLLAILLWKMFLPNHKDLGQRIAFFVPVSCLLFQLQYVETLNWAMPSLQNLPVLLFSLGTIHFLMQPTKVAFCWAMFGLVLAVAASGNGFLLIPIGLLILIADRRYVRVFSWLAISAGCIAAYAYRYSVASSQSQTSTVSKVIRPHPLSFLAFLGNAAEIPFVRLNHRLVVSLCLLLGTLICIFFVDLARRNYMRRNPTVCYCALFLFLTAVGVSGLRSGLGIAHSLDSRYKIYSALMLIFVWFAIVEEFLQHQDLPIMRNRVFLAVVASAALFCISMNAWGWLYLEQRNRRIVEGLAAYEHPVPGASVGPVLPFPHQGVRFDELDRQAPIILRRSTELGVYRPPPL